MLFLTTGVLKIEVVSFPAVGDKMKPLHSDCVKLENLFKRIDQLHFDGTIQNIDNSNQWPHRHYKIPNAKLNSGSKSSF